MDVELIPAARLGERGLLHHWLLGDVEGQRWLPSYAHPSLLVRLMNTPGHEFLIGYRAGEPVGFVHVEHLPEGEATLAYYVPQVLRGQGLGVALVVAATVWAAGVGIRRLLALVEPGNAVSLSVVKRAGFTFESGRAAETQVYVWSR